MKDRTIRASKKSRTEPKRQHPEEIPKIARVESASLVQVSGTIMDVEGHYAAVLIDANSEIAPQNIDFNLSLAAKWHFQILPGAKVICTLLKIKDFGAYLVRVAPEGVDDEPPSLEHACIIAGVSMDRADVGQQKSRSFRYPVVDSPLPSNMSAKKTRKEPKNWIDVLSEFWPKSQNYKDESEIRPSVPTKTDSSLSRNIRGLGDENLESEHEISTTQRVIDEKHDISRHQYLDTYLEIEGVPDAARPALAREIHRLVVRAARPRWTSRLDYRDLRELSAPGFLRRVHDNEIREGIVNKEEIRALDPELMAAVENYIAARKRRGRDLGDAEGLRFELRRPAPNALPPYPKPRKVTLT
jgi:hypothetical protein